MYLLRNESCATIQHLFQKFRKNQAIAIHQYNYRNLRHHLLFHSDIQAQYRHDGFEYSDSRMIKVFMMQKELYKSYTIPIKNITKIEFINTIGFVFCYYYHGIYITMIWYAIIMAILMLFFKKETITFVKFIKKIR